MCNGAGTPQTPCEPPISAPERKPWSFKRAREEHPVIIILTALVTGFLAGIGTYQGILTIAKLEVCSIEKLETFKQMEIELNRSKNISTGAKIEPQPQVVVIPQVPQPGQNNPEIKPVTPPKLKVARTAQSSVIEVSWENLPNQKWLYLVTSDGNRYYAPMRIPESSGRANLPLNSGITMVAIVQSNKKIQASNEDELNSPKNPINIKVQELIPEK